MSEHAFISPQSPTTAPAAVKDVMPVQEQLQNETDSQSFQKLTIQCKLSIGSPNDPLEHEADAMADKVMRMPKQNFIQRRCDNCEEEDKVQRSPLVSFIQKKGAQEGMVASNSVSNRIASSRGKGSGLVKSTKSFMENRFGTDFSKVNVHTGGEAVQMNRELGAKAFTVGDDIYFNERQYNQHSLEGKYLLAHELTHVVQQRGNQATSVCNPSLKNFIQRYSLIGTSNQSSTEWNAGEDIRVAENGMTATSENTSSKLCYAHPSLIVQSNRELSTRNSGVQLIEQSASLNGTAPDGSSRKTLKQVLPLMAFSSSGSGTSQTSWADCGRMSREVMGRSGSDETPHGICMNSSGDLIETTRTSSPEEQKGNILVALGLGTTFSSALSAYNAMSVFDRDVFDRRHGLNRYAEPSVGESFTSHEPRGFNFHWGGVVFNPGVDRVTLENFFKGGNYDSQDTQWYFQTYGPATNPGQTWQDQWDNPLGDTFTTRTSARSLRGSTNSAGVRLVDLPSNWDNAAHYVNLSQGTQVLKIRTDNTRWVEVRVLNGPYIGRTGHIMAHFFNGN